MIDQTAERAPAVMSTEQSGKLRIKLSLRLAFLLVVFAAVKLQQHAMQGL